MILLNLLKIKLDFNLKFGGINMNNVKKIINDLDNLRVDKGNEYVKDTFENTVLKSKNPYLSYYFINTLEVNYIEKHIENIINSNDNKLIYDTILSSNVDLQSRDELIKTIIDSKDAYHCYLIAYNVYKRNNYNTKLEHAVLDAKNPGLCYKYALNIEGTDIKGHEQVILDSGNVEWCYKFAKDIKNANVKALEQVVFNSNNLEYITLFALEVKGADIASLATKVLQSKDPHWNYLFASQITGADILKHGSVVIESLNAEYNFVFARDIKGADIIRHENAVVESKNIEYIYRFALDVKEANVVELRNALLENASKDDLDIIFKDEEFNEKYQNSIIKNKILSLSK